MAVPAPGQTPKSGAQILTKLLFYVWGLFFGYPPSDFRDEGDEKDAGKPRKMNLIFPKGCLSISLLGKRTKNNKNVRGKSASGGSQD
ncbi:hypothetical protein RUM43_000139 [Polyplax serrata]|uniref:Uncharacterized protein n=1 Tax=Polyplax serrata TaxID=468196 RepID=A0AAN8SFG4_POLSC